MAEIAPSSHGLRAVPAVVANGNLLSEVDVEAERPCYRTSTRYLSAWVRRVVDDHQERRRLGLQQDDEMLTHARCGLGRWKHVRKGRSDFRPVANRRRVGGLRDVRASGLVVLRALDGKRLLDHLARPMSLRGRRRRHHGGQSIVDAHFSARSPSSPRRKSVVDSHVLTIGQCR